MATDPSIQPPVPPDGERIAVLCEIAARSGAPADTGAPRSAEAEDAIEELLFLHHARFLGFARRKLGVDFAGKLDAEDVLQDAYAEVFRTIARFEHRGDDSFYHWVTRIIDQRFIDSVRALRRKKRDATREQSIGGAGIVGDASRHVTLCRLLSADDPTPSRSVRRDDTVAAMLACLSRMEPDDRLVIERIHLRGDHPAEVGREMGRSEDAVRRLTGRALERLRALMGRASRYLTRS